MVHPLLGSSLISPLPPPLRFCNNKIVRACGLLLADYSSNSELTNHAVLKMLYCIAVKMKMAPLLYHSTMFQTFHAILAEPPGPRIKVLLANYVQLLLLVLKVQV